MIACQYWTEVAGRSWGRCALGIGGGRPSPGVCERCLREGTNNEQAAHALRERESSVEQPRAQIVRAPASGPGTELKKLLGRLGIKAAPNCKCNARAALMDLCGPAWCREHIDEIVEWLREEASLRRLPFIPVAARVVVLLAIRRSQAARTH